MYWRLAIPALVAVMGGWVLLRPSSSGESVPAPAAPQREALAADGGERRPADQLIPARIRRLSNAEFDASVRALLGTELALGQGFAPDARQSGFSENEAQLLDTVFAKQVAGAAEKLAAEARPRVDRLAPCQPGADGEGCARAFIAGFGARAYRRPLSAAEQAGLLDVYRAGALDASYADGIQLVIRALLQSPGFMYLTELGETPAADGEVALTGAELAAALAYLVTGGPPDQALLDAAAAGELASPDARRWQLQRLRAHPQSRAHLVRMLREWLQLDAIEVTAKDINFYANYELMWRPFIRESHDFVAAVVDLDAERWRKRDDPNSDLRTLLAADWTVGEKALAGFYGAKPLPGGRLQLRERRGVLNQGAFLSVQAHARSSAPVLRGVLVARRLACIDVPSPQSLGINTLPPPPDPKLTTRQRFEQHTTNPICADCHDKLDPFGNAFEQYDGMGQLRQSDNSQDVDSAVEIALGADFDGRYKDSNALAEALAKSARVRECFARNVFRAAAARSGESSSAAEAAPSEDAFIAEWRALPENRQGNLMDTLSTYVGSPLFTHRRAL
jgi:hypothetical protein